jgi:hypothetical protein
LEEGQLAKVKSLLEKIDHSFEEVSDDDLINDAFDPYALNNLDRGDMINMIEELARRYQNVLMIISRLDEPKH